MKKYIGAISTTALFLLLGTTGPAFAQEHNGEAAKPAQQEEAAKPAQHEEQAKPASHAEETKPAKQETQPKPAKQEAQSKPAQRQSQPKPAAQESHASSAKQESQPKPAQHTAQAKPAKQENDTHPAKQESQEKPAQHAAAAKPARQQTQAQQHAAKPEEHGNAGGQQHAQRTPAEEQRQRAVPALRLSARGSGRIPDDRFRSNFGHDHVFVINQPVLVGGYSRFQYGGYSFGFIQPWPVGWYYTDNVYVDYIDGEYFLFNPYYPGVRVGINVVL